MSDATLVQADLLEAVRRKFQQDPVLLALTTNGVFFREAPTSLDSSATLRLPYVVIDAGKGPTDWNTGGSGTTDVMLTITVYCADDTAAWKAVGKLKAAFESTRLDLSSHNATTLLDYSADKDSPLVWVGWAVFSFSMTETGNGPAADRLPGTSVEPLAP